MMYRLPYKGLRKQVSLLLAGAMAFLLLLFIIQLFLQKKNENNVRSKTINCIIDSKRNLRRGSFGFVVRQSQRSEEYDMAGYDYFFDKIQIGDSVSKQKNTYFFDVYRKDSLVYQYIETIGYK